MSKFEVIETRSAEPVDAPEDLDAAARAVDEIRSGVTALEEKQAAALKAAEARIAAMETRLNRPQVQAEQRNEQTDEQRAFNSYIRRGDAITELERRALTVGVDANGGYTAPPEFATELLSAIRDLSPIRQYATVTSIGAKEIKFPKKLTSTTGAWVDETEPRPETTMTFGQLTIAAKEYACFVDVSRQLLEDSAVDIEAELRRDLSETFAIAEGQAFVAGDGVKQPLGMLSTAGIATVSTGAASTLGTALGDKLILMQAALPTAYAARGTWVMNRNLLAAIRSLKDSQGNYLWQPGLTAGAPSTILGRPVAETVDMPAVAANAMPILFGDLSAYRIVDRVGFGILVDPYTQARNGLVRFHARRRVGGALTDVSKVVGLKVAA